MTKMTNVFKDVREFHEALDIPVGEKPSFPQMDQQLLRDALDHEEMQEYLDAVSEQDLAHIAKEAMDLIYVVVGRLLVYGIDPQPIWEAVHKSNMAKAMGPRREDGKILKPKGWKAPDIQEILEQQGAK